MMTCGHSWSEQTMYWCDGDCWTVCSVCGVKNALPLKEPHDTIRPSTIKPNDDLVFNTRESNQWSRRSEREWREILAMPLWFIAWDDEVRH